MWAFSDMCFDSCPWHPTVHVLLVLKLLLQHTSQGETVAEAGMNANTGMLTILTGETKLRSASLTHGHMCAGSHSGPLTSTHGWQGQTSQAQESKRASGTHTLSSSSQAPSSVITAAKLPVHILGISSRYTLCWLSRQMRWRVCAGALGNSCIWH